jgi:hypothetical protein
VHDNSLSELSASLTVDLGFPPSQDSTFVYASYAAVFLLKLVSPTFASFIDEDAAMKLVRDTADVLEKSAVDEQHTPALCEFLTRSKHPKIKVTDQ